MEHSESDVLAKILAGQPEQKLLGSQNRCSLIITGPPGSGKTTLAQRLSEALELKLVSPLSVVNAAIADPASPHHAEVLRCLEAGQAVPWRIVLELIEIAVFSETALFQGFVLDGIPNSHRDHQEDPTNSGLSLLQKISQFYDTKSQLSPQSQKHSVYFIELDMKLDDIVLRRSSHKMDSQTGQVYPGHQIEQSIAHHFAAEEPEDLDTEQQKPAENDDWMLIDDGSDDEDDNKKSKKGGEDWLEEEEEEEEELDPDSEPHLNKKKTRRPPLAASKLYSTSTDQETVSHGIVKLLAQPSSFPTLPRAVISRLVRRPEDDLENVSSEYHAWKTVSKENLHNWAKESFSSVHTVAVDATQHPTEVFLNVVESLESSSQIPGSLEGRIVRARKLPTPDPTVKAPPEAEVIKWLSTIDLLRGEPKREISSFLMYCPVTLHTKRELVKSSFDYPVVYRGYLFFVQNEDYLDRFIANPDRYVSKPPFLPEMKVCVMGGPFSGKTTQAKAIAVRYGLQYISLEDVLFTWDNHKEQGELQKSNPLYSKIVRKLRAGKPIPGDMLVDILKASISSSKRDNLSTTDGRGWVLDGYPRTMEQAQALTNSGMIPKYAAILQNDINEENVRSRKRIHVDPTTGLPIIDSAYSNCIHSDYTPGSIECYPYFDNLFNGFKEELIEVTKVLEEFDVTLVQAPAELDPTTVLGVIQSGIDTFFPKAEFLGGKDVPPEPELGLTKDYCPWTLKEKQILTKGSPSLCVRYEEKYYYLASEEAKNAFVTAPHTFVSPQQLPASPPPRVVVLGVASSGKSSCIRKLNLASGPVHLSFWEFLAEVAKSLDTGLKEDVEDIARERAGMLTPSMVIEMMKYLYYQSPYNSRGFILEGFPRNKSEAEVMLKEGFHVDACVVFQVDPEVAARRQLTLLRQQALLRAQALEGNMNELYTRTTNKLDRMSDEDLQEMFTETSEREAVGITEVTGTFEAMSSIPIVDIDANKFTRPVVAQLKALLKPFVENRSNIFCSPIAIARDQAEIFIRLGIKTFSKFGRYCPVVMKNQGRNTKLKKGRLPVLFEDQIYFLRNEANRGHFMKNPKEYVVQSSPSIILRPTVAVVGRAKVGKTTLARRIAMDHNMIYLDIPIVIQSILEGAELTTLRLQVKAALENGEELPEAVVTECFKTVTKRGVCQLSGWVIDGFPGSMNNAKEAEENGISPQVIIELRLNNTRMKERSEEDYQQLLRINKPSIENMWDVIETRDQKYLPHLKVMREYYTDRRANWKMLDGSESKWALKKTALELVVSSIDRRQQYMHFMMKDLAASIHDIGVLINTIPENMGKFGEFCPVSFVDEQQLIVGAPGTLFVAEYKSKFYRMAGSVELGKFLRDPHKYAFGPNLPEQMPLHKPATYLKEAFPRQIELSGFCPVTLQECPTGFDSIVLGNSNCLVEYEGKLFCMETEDKLRRFLKYSGTYSNQAQY
ncbi:hypothetical protein BJ742DRAFT_317871 [Cladochytrium replicatum]|nr:hypothetical protein BJ742DRAFT_317871 [Cladochytrium replicatum]